MSLRLLSIAVLGLALVAGCESTRQALAPSVGLRASNNEIMVNETTTIFAKTENLVGRDPDVRWNSTLGQLEISEDGRQARLKADQPGTAFVTIEVTTADGQVLRDQQKIEIKSLPR